MLDRNPVSLPRYSIGVVSRLTGLSADTIRAWERRYGFVRPARGAGRIRVYGDAEVARLTLARRATAQGHPIRYVATLDDAAIAVLVDAGQSDTLNESDGAQHAVVAAALDALRNVDPLRLKRTIRTATAMMEPRDLILHIFVPLLQQVGTLWEERALSIWQEHLLSELIGSTAGTIARMADVKHSGAGMLFATPPKELHAFGTAFAAMLAASRGYRTYNLGPNLPAREVIVAATRLEIGCVVLGVTGNGGVSGNLREYFQELDETLPRRIGIRVGGRASGDLRKELAGTRVRTVPTLKEFAIALT